MHILKIHNNTRLIIKLLVLLDFPWKHTLLASTLKTNCILVPPKRRLHMQWQLFKESLFCSNNCLQEENSSTQFHCALAQSTMLQRVLHFVSIGSCTQKKTKPNNKNPTCGSTFLTLTPLEHTGWKSSDFPAAIEGFWLNPCVCKKQQNNLVCYHDRRYGLIKTEKEINCIDIWRSVSFRDTIAHFY